MTPEQVQVLVRKELSHRSRVTHAGLLVLSLAMATSVTSLWLTEAALPRRTHAAFGMLVVVALAWAAHAAWVLTHRAVLLVPHQVRAARLAMACCLVFLIACAAAWVIYGGQAPIFSLLTSMVMCAAALFNLRRARSRHAALLRRRSELS